MRRRLIDVVSVALALLTVAAWSAEGKTLEPGQSAPEFSLQGVAPQTQGAAAAQAGEGSGAAVRSYSLKDFADADVLAVVFLANHCPVATAYEERVIDLARQYKDRGVAFVAISPNAPRPLPAGEPITDRGDSLEEMKVRAQKKGFNFPYLYDGDQQEVSRAFGPVATPHVFIFDKERKLRYAGRIDNSQDPARVTSSEARDALEALLAGKQPPVAQTKAFGCSIKWRSGGASAAAATGGARMVADEKAEAAKGVTPVDARGIGDLVRNADSGKLRLINVWATWCGPCREELPDLAAISQAYGTRGLDVVTISADQPGDRDKAHQVLSQQGVRGRSYIFSGSDPSQLIDAVDKQWQGAIPYTLLVAPGGEVVYRTMGKFSPPELRKAIESRLGQGERKPQ